MQCIFACHAFKFRISNCDLSPIIPAHQPYSSLLVLAILYQRKAICNRSSLKDLAALAPSLAGPSRSIAADQPVSHAGMLSSQPQPALTKQVKGTFLAGFTVTRYARRICTMSSGLGGPHCEPKLVIIAASHATPVNETMRQRYHMRNQLRIVAACSIHG